MDFHKRRKMPGDWLFKVVPVLIVAAWVVVIAALGYAGYVVATTGPREVGQMAGEVVAGYNEAAQ